MATSGSCSTSAYNNKKWVNFNWSRVNYVSDNSECSSGIYFELYGAGSDSSSWHWAGPIKVWINRTSGEPDFTFWGSRQQLYNGTFIGSGDFKINHNTDGTGSFSVYIEAAIYSSAINCYGSGAWDLDSLPRQATLTGAIDFNSDGNPYMEFSNPGGLVVDCYLEFGGTNIIRENVPNTGNYTFNLTDAERQLLLSKCPNSNSLSLIYGIQTRVNGEAKWWSYTGRTMYVVNSNPTFSNCAYKDVGEESIKLTGEGNNQTLINGFNELQVTISTANKAVARNGATMSRYRLVCGNKTIEKPYSSSSDVVMSLADVTNMTFILYAIDSRGNSTAITKSVSEWKNYSPIVIKTGSATRDGGVGTETTLTFEGTIWNNTFGAVDNEIVKCQYRYKKSNESAYGNPIDVTPVREEDLFSFSSKITGDIETEGFNLTNSFNIQIIIADKINTITYDILLGAGTPAMAIHRNGVAFGAPYDENVGGSHQVDGVNMSPEFTINEKKVGFWTNGKPIYRKILQGTTGASTNVTLGSIPNLETLVDIRGVAGATYRGSLTWINLGVSPQQYRQVYVVNNTVGMIQHANEATPYIVILEYTKTTD